MRSRLYQAASALVFVSAACAQGSTAPDFTGPATTSAATGSSSQASGSGTGGASVTSTSATSGSGGAGSGGGATSASSTQATSSTSSTSGGTCPDSPCKLTSPQCGCPSGEACSVYSAQVSCLTPGTKGRTQLCSGSNDCQAGLTCVASGSSSSSPGICEKFCDTDSDCTAPGGLCVITLSNGSGGAIPNVTLCTDNCDLFTNGGCAAQGTSCQLGQEPTGQMRWLTICAAAGTLGKGAVCDPNNNQCAPTLGCLNLSGQPQCYQYCQVGSPLACATCTALQDANFQPITIGPVAVGVCM